MSKKVNEIITQRFIDGLKKGRVPWQKPWSGGIYNRPANFKSKQFYRGINIMLLGMAGYASPHWMTYKQVTEKGGNVIKGEKASPVVFWKILDKDTGATKKDGTPEIKKIFMLRYYNVFNAEQIEGIEFPEVEKPETYDTTEDERGEKIWHNYEGRPALKIEGNAAVYVADQDLIRMPHIERFRSAAGYYATLFHEMTHSTGHKSRLDRGLHKPITTAERSLEELIAEIGANFLMAEAGLEVDEGNTQAYINHWINFLKNNPDAIIKAASRASKAVEMVLNTEKKKVEEYA